MKGHRNFSMDRNQPGAGLPAISTPLMLNVGSPGMAFGYGHLPHHGVGLAREEFIINNYIGVHPMALLTHRTLKDAALSEAIAKKIPGFDGEEDFFIGKLSYGIARIAAAFYLRNGDRAVLGFQEQ